MWCTICCWGSFTNADLPITSERREKHELRRCIHHNFWSDLFHWVNQTFWLQHFWWQNTNWLVVWSRWIVLLCYTNFNHWPPTPGQQSQPWYQNLCYFKLHWCTPHVLIHCIYLYLFTCVNQYFCKSCFFLLLISGYQPPEIRQITIVYSGNIHIIYIPYFTEHNLNFPAFNSIPASRGRYV